jgi:hypothetical protein
MPVFGRFTQTVTIEGQPALVHDLSIKESSSQKVSSIDFVLEELQVTNQTGAYSNAQIGATVAVEQSVAGTTQQWSMVIVDVNEKRAGAYSFKRLQCRSLEYVASATRFLDLWEDTAASTVVREAWERHAINSPTLAAVDLSGIQINNTIINEYASKFDSLYDVMDEVCLLTGWSWRIGGPVASPTLFFYDPLAVQGPTIRQSDYRIEADTVDLKQSLQGVYNVYRMQAFGYTEITLKQFFEVGDCVDGLLFDPQKLKGYEIVGDPEIQEQGWKDLGLEVDQVEVEEGILRLNGSRSKEEGDPAALTINVRARRLVWVERLNEESILLFGRRDAPPISDNGGLKIAAATQYLDEMLAYKSTPAADLSLSLTGVGWIPDMLVDVELDDPQLNATLYVTDVTRTTNGNDLDVSITLTTPGEVIEGAVITKNGRSRSKVDPAYEIGRRVERLERRLAHPAQPLGQTTGIFGVFAGTFTGEDTAGWSAITTVTIDNVQGDVTGWSSTTTVTIDNVQGDVTGWSSTTTTTVVGLTNLEDTTGWNSTTDFVIQNTAMSADEDVVLNPSPPENILSFDGTNDLVTIANDGSLDVSNFRVNARFRSPPSAAGTGDLLTIYNNQEGDFLTRSVVIWINGGQSSFANNAIVARTVDGGGSPVSVVADNQDYFDGNWHDIELVCVQGTSLTLIVDGVQRDQALADVQPLLSMLENTIGAENSSPRARFFDGDISLVEIIDEGPTTPVTVAKYDMSGITGTILPDVSGNGNDGTINGATPGTD